MIILKTKSTGLYHIERRHQATGQPCGFSLCGRHVVPGKLERTDDVPTVQELCLDCRRMKDRTHTIWPSVWTTGSHRAA